MDLNKSLLELIMQNPKTSLQNVVADALSYEAKKVMRWTGIDRIYKDYAEIIVMLNCFFTFSI